MESTSRPQAYIHTAIEAIRFTSKLLLQNMDRIDRLTRIEEAGHPLTLTLELKIIESLKHFIMQKHPEHGFFDATCKPHELNLLDSTWIIGGLGGAENFALSIPIHCLSIAFMHKRQLLVSVIYNVVTDETFSALYNQSSRLNDRRIRAGHTPQKLVPSVIACDLPPERLPTELQKLSVRAFGSHTLSLAYTASGKIDAYYAENVPYHALAAAKLLATEAKIKLLTIPDPKNPLVSKQVLALGPKSYHNISL